MSYEEAYGILKKLANDEIITLEMKNKLDGYCKWLISRMRDEVISRDEQSLLDFYINYLRATITDMDIVSEYDKVVDERNNPVLNEEHRAQKEGHYKVLVMEKKNGVNNNGIILTTVILEVALLLGLTLAILILALS